MMMFQGQTQRALISGCQLRSAGKVLEGKMELE